jgi:hypothetical protein
VHRPRGVLILPLVGAAAALALLPITSSDLTDYVIPWLRALQQRGAAGLLGEFPNYTPPYICLLYLVKGLEPLVGSVALVKLVNVPLCKRMVLPVRIELTTSALPRMRSTTELRQHFCGGGAPMTVRAAPCQAKRRWSA